MNEYADGKVLVEQVQAVTIVTINRADVKNACNVATVKGLHDAFMAFEADADQRVAILTGVGRFVDGAGRHGSVQ